MPHVVAIEDEGRAAKRVESLLDGMRQRRFPGAGEAGKPQDHAAVTVLALAIAARDQGGMPLDMLIGHGESKAPECGAFNNYGKRRYPWASDLADSRASLAAERKFAGDAAGVRLFILFQDLITVGASRLGLGEARTPILDRAAASGGIDGILLVDALHRLQLASLQLGATAQGKHQAGDHHDPFHSGVPSIATGPKPAKELTCTEFSACAAASADSRPC